MLPPSLLIKVAMNFLIVVINFQKCDQCPKDHKSLGSLTLSGCSLSVIVIFASLSSMLSLSLLSSLIFVGYVMSPIFYCLLLLCHTLGQHLIHESFLKAFLDLLLLLRSSATPFTPLVLGMWDFHYNTHI